ncbi:MAG: DUF2953 domain-containing protein [Nitrospirota bacterium]|nr:DUF2953 domain-containing protein [Nitrospirota bacterium]
MLWAVAIAGGLLALLAVPVDVAVAAHRRDRLETRLTVGWLWGVVSLRAPGPGPNRPPRPKRKKKPRLRKPSGTRRALAMARSADFPRRVLRLGRDLLHRIHIRRLDLDLRLGLADPADTGRLWGLIGPAAALLALPSTARIAITPEFSEPLLHMDAHAQVRIVPAVLLGVLARFMLSPTTLRALLAAARGTP